MLRIIHRGLSSVLLSVLFTSAAVGAQALSPAAGRSPLAAAGTLSSSQDQITGTDPEPIDPDLIEAILTVLSLA
jgi:hypothetical protein